MSALKVQCPVCYEWFEDGLLDYENHRREHENRSVAAFIERQGITSKAEYHGKKKDDQGWEHFAWTITLERGGVTISTPFRMGLAHTMVGKPRRIFAQGEWSDNVVGKPPETADVLDSMASDSSSYDNARNFEDWAADYGYDTDSRKAESLYRQVADQAHALKFLLGPEAYEELLWKTERL